LNYYPYQGQYYPLPQADPQQPPARFNLFPGGGGQPGFPFPPGFPGGTPFPGQQPGFPGGGGQPFPGGGGQPGFPGGGEGQGQAGGPPSSPPPSFTPELQTQSASVFAVDPGAIRGCLYRFTYLWLNNGRSFWFYPTFVGRTSVAGWRWRGFRWEYYGTDTNRIRSFRCT
jgi:hypothetical protein